MTILFISLNSSASAKAVQKGKSGKVAIPPHAVEISQGVFSLGWALDQGRFVQGLAIVDYRDGDSGCSDCSGGNNGGDSGTSTCYGFLSKGAKWKGAPEPWIVNPNNSRGLDENFVSANLATDIAKWEDAADGIVGDAGFIDILGEGSVTADTLVADTVSTDGKNEVYFADIEGQNTIGITIVWGIFNGPPRWRELVEWDQVYNDADFDWSEDCNSEDCTTKMDFESIATHELGHSVGLDDLYEDRCSEQTMYGYGDFGETAPRTLEAGDITGISELY
jgi:hypothetical protein